MTHAFLFSEEWGKKLTEEAPRLGRTRGLVRENVKVCKDGGFDFEHGERVVVPTPPKTERIVPPNVSSNSSDPLRFSTTNVTVALIDTLSAALALGESSAALNFANAYHPGGGYKIGAQAQEEDLCRLLPQLIHSLECVKYPIAEYKGECLVTRGLMAVRQVGTYQLCQCQGLVNILTAAMPCGDAGRPGQQSWKETVSLRIRGVLHAAKVSGFTKLVLGAWGCGAFGNPPGLVSKLFRSHLCSPEFRGAFSDVVFAIVDPRGDGNFKPFKYEIMKIDESEKRAAPPEIVKSEAHPETDESKKRSAPPEIDESEKPPEHTTNSMSLL